MVGSSYFVIAIVFLLRIVGLEARVNYQISILLMLRTYADFLRLLKYDLHKRFSTCSTDLELTLDHC